MLAPAVSAVGGAWRAAPGRRTGTVHWPVLACQPASTAAISPVAKSGSIQPAPAWLAAGNRSVESRRAAP